MEFIKWKVLLIIPMLFLSTSQLPTESEKIQKRYGDALAAIMGIGIRLQAVLEDPSSTSNFIVSPISAAVAIAQLILGTEGELQDNLYYLLSLPNTQEADKTTVISYFHKNNNFSYVLPYARLHLQLGALLKVLARDSIGKPYKLSCSSVWFVNKDIKLKQEFLQNLRIFESQVFMMNYSTDPIASQNFINKWTADHTNQLIQKILYSPLPASTSAVFLNTVHFKAEWETPFSDELNIMGPFQVTPTKQSQVTFMRGYMDSVQYIENKEAKYRMLGLPYKNNELIMFIIMPTDDHEHKFNLKRFIYSLKGSNILTEIQSAKRKQVLVTLPKFNLTNTVSLLEPMEKFLAFRASQKNKQPLDVNLTGNAVDLVEKGVGEFVTSRTTENVDIQLTRAVDNGNFRLSNMLQEMTISVNEKGTEAAAVSMSIIDYIGGSKNFRVDRPFVFFIRHELTTAPLFWGMISDPSLNH
ncbi:heterochromatin-associated protein MENT-like [Agrilus planipennis]|uniref:Heterochromatin-associated protein MENT-like n=1 Tax=Agrilus planipennis TaxID=224129 RepID=A0A1W4XI68_AGRPL|nr:heterochromatin-associated protein MENT-like [Agrilus planipennis]XP_018335679.1 heterochromatin-associated protein MENT-like [Agrilus planipennis]